MISKQTKNIATFQIGFHSFSMSALLLDDGKLLSMNLIETLHKVYNKCGRVVPPAQGVRAQRPLSSYIHWTLHDITCTPDIQ